LLLQVSYSLKGKRSGVAGTKPCRLEADPERLLKEITRTAMDCNLLLL